MARPSSSKNCPHRFPIMDQFSQLSENDVVKLIKCSAKKTCKLDAMPTMLVVNCVDPLLPVITKMINLSLSTGCFSDEWKCAIVNPLLKKAGLDLIFNNYRPVSNLQYISKLTEKAVYEQVHLHTESNTDINPLLQSAYRKQHSTETALLKVMNDILLKMNSQHVTLLVMLDLSAAFDTVNHKILLERLQHDIGISGVPLQWFQSYLSNRSQRIDVQGTLSQNFSLECGLPQGSCLGPLLYIIYTSKLFKIIEHHLPDAHCYADDTQLYLSFRPTDGLSSQIDAIQAMERCIKDIRHWMISNRLLLNDDKTEFLLIGTRQQLNKVESIPLKVGAMDIEPISCVRNLGAWFDSTLSMGTHINKVCKSGFYYLHNLRKIRKYLSQDCLSTLIHAFITSRLDYCNSLMYGLPQRQISKLQRLQNAAARLALDLSKFCHITPALRQLHWLPVVKRIQFKILLLTFKSIHGLSPPYISELITIKPKTSYSLRSNNSILLQYPQQKLLSTLGARSFASAAPALWNKLPADIRNVTSLNEFKKMIKTFLFNVELYS